MKYRSTGTAPKEISFREAISQNMPADGGLFVPSDIPKLDINPFLKMNSYIDFANAILENYLDSSKIELSEITSRAFVFPTPLTKLDSRVFYLELFHGPTAAFKDYGARFFAETLRPESGTVLVATSGDTGGAVASAFWKMNNFRVIILFPENRVSKRQERQLTNWGENIKSYAVKGGFDDCQRMVKSAFQKTNLNLKSANSINIGRILPQVIYYAYSSVLAYKENKKPSRFFVPTGNAGNACAAVWAKKMGFPISEVVLCSNANSTLADYVKTGSYRARTSISTLANAMDVGSPSNFERILHLYNRDLNQLRKDILVTQTFDAEIQSTIKAKPYDQLLCPHTATAFNSYKKMETDDKVNSILVGTAHPAKFESIVEPLIGQIIPVPEALAETLSRPGTFETISSDENSFLKILS